MSRRLLADPEKGWEKACSASGNALGCVAAQNVHPDPAQGGFELQPAHDSGRHIQRQVQSYLQLSWSPPTQSLPCLAPRTQRTGGIASCQVCTGRPAGAGQPEFAVDVDNVKPTGLVIGAALIMLALGKPLTGSRAFGGASFALPQMGDCKAMVSLFSPVLLPKQAVTPYDTALKGAAQQRLLLGTCAMVTCSCLQLHGAGVRRGTGCL